jgi:LAT3 family solute carrier family 43 protein 3
MHVLTGEHVTTQALFVLCMFVNCLFAGVLFGWAPLQLLLIKDGVFADRCKAGFDNSGGDSCDEQLVLINLLYTIGSTASIIGSFASGAILDNYGFLANAFFAGAFNALGFLLFALAPNNSLPLLIIAVSLIGTGGIFTFFCAFGISSLVYKANIPLVLTGANVFFDCSAVIPLVFYQLFNAGYSRRGIFISYAVVACFTFTSYMLLFYIESRHRVPSATTPGTAAEAVATAEDEEDSVHSNRSTVIGVEVPHTHRRRRRDSQDSDFSHPSQASASQAEREPGQYVHDHDHFVTLPWTQQLKSYYFLYIVCFSTVMMLRSNIYLGTVQILLEDYNDDDHNYLFTQIFIVILPFGFLFIPAISYLLKKYGFATFFQLVSLTGIGYGVIAVIPVLPLQVLTFVLYATHRAFLYSVIATFNACVFGNKNAGRIHGFTFLIAGVINLSQWPLMLAIFAYANGNLFYLYIALLLLCIPSLFHTELFLRPAMAKDDNDVLELPKQQEEATPDIASLLMDDTLDVDVDGIELALTMSKADSKDDAAEAAI